MKFKNDPIKSPFKTKLKQIRSGSDSIVELNGEVYLQSTGQRLIERKDLGQAAMIKLREAMRAQDNK